MIQPFLFIHQYDSHIKLHINGFDQGYRQICWYERENPGSLKFKEATSPDFILDGVHKGDYIFYSRGYDGVKSAKMRVFIQENFAPERVAQYKTYMSDFEDSEINQKFIEDFEFAVLHDQDKPTLFILADQYEDMVKSKKEVLLQDNAPFYKMCPLIEKYENRILASMNKNSFGNATLSYEPVPLLTCHELVNEIHIYKVNHGREIFDRRIPLFESNQVRIPFVESQAYVIYLFQGADKVGVLHHYQLDNESMNKIWHNLTVVEQQYKDIVEDDAFIGAIDVATLEPEERKMYAEEYHITSADTIFPRLLFGGTDGYLEDGHEINGLIDVAIPYYPLLSAFKQELYIVNRDTDFLLDDTFDNYKLIDKARININPRENSSSDNQFFFIADAEGRILNRAERYSRNENLYDYKVKRNKLELIAYFKHLRTMFKENYPEALAVVDDIMVAAENDDSLNIDNITDYVIDRIVKTGLPYGTDDAIHLILQDKFARICHSKNFFESESCIFHAGEKRFSFQPQTMEYVLVVGFVSLQSNGVLYSYYHSGLGAIDVPMNDAGIYFAYAISEDDFRTSGFLEFNSLTCKYETWNLEVTVNRA